MLTMMLALHSAHAVEPATRPSGSLLLGVGALPGSDQPETFRGGVRLNVPVIASNVVGLGVVFPVEMATSGDSGFGFRTQNTALEAAPSLRALIAPSSVVRPYLEGGLGVVHRFSQVETWFGSASQGRTVPMFRSAFGLEIGGTQPNSLALVVEPVGYRHYGLDGEGADRFAFMAGVQSTF